MTDSGTVIYVRMQKGFEVEEFEITQILPGPQGEVGEQGEQGEQGDPGAPGEDGLPGASLAPVWLAGRNGDPFVCPADDESVIPWQVTQGPEGVVQSGGTIMPGEGIHVINGWVNIDFTGTTGYARVYVFKNGAGGTYFCEMAPTEGQSYVSIPISCRVTLDADDELTIVINPEYEARVLLPTQVSGFRVDSEGGAVTGGGGGGEVNAPFWRMEVTSNYAGPSAGNYQKAQVVEIEESQSGIIDSGNHRVTPGVPGVYLVEIWLYWGGTGQVRAHLDKSGSEIRFWTFSSPADGVCSGGGVHMVRLDADDYLEFRVYSSAGGITVAAPTNFNGFLVAAD